METTIKLRVRGLGFRVWGSGVSGGLDFRVYAWGRIVFRVQGLSFRDLEFKF